MKVFITLAKSTINQFETAKRKLSYGEPIHYVRIMALLAYSQCHASRLIALRDCPHLFNWLSFLSFFF